MNLKIFSNGASNALKPPKSEHPKQFEILPLMAEIQFPTPSEHKTNEFKDALHKNHPEPIQKCTSPNL